MHCNRAETNIDPKPIILFEQSHTTKERRRKQDGYRAAFKSQLGLEKHKRQIVKSNESSLRDILTLVERRM